MDLILRADAGEHAIDQADDGAMRGGEGTHLRHEPDQRGLPQVCGFTRHVRPGDDAHDLAHLEADVVRDIALAFEAVFHDRMAALPYVEHIGINHLRAEDVVRSGAEILATACPYCLTMLEDGLKARNKDEAVKVYVIAELVEKSMGDQPKAG